MSKETSKTFKTVVKVIEEFFSSILLNKPEYVRVCRGGGIFFMPLVKSDIKYANKILGYEYANNMLVRMGLSGVVGMVTYVNVDGLIAINIYDVNDSGKVIYSENSKGDRIGVDEDMLKRYNTGSSKDGSLVLSKEVLRGDCEGTVEVDRGYSRVTGEGDAITEEVEKMEESRCSLDDIKKDFENLKSRVNEMEGVILTNNDVRVECLSGDKACTEALRFATDLSYYTGYFCTARVQFMLEVFQGNELIGVGCMFVKDRTCIISSFVVKSRYRGYGIGKSITECLKKIGLGCKDIDKVEMVGISLD